MCRRFSLSFSPTDSTYAGFLSASNSKSDDDMALGVK